VSTQEDIWPIVDRLTFFNSFTTDEKRQIVSDDAYFKVYRAGEMLIRQGSRKRSLFIILAGSVSIIKGANSTVLTVLQAGEIFGEMAFFAETHRTASVIAREPVIALEMDRPLFERLSSTIREKFKDKIIARLVDRLDRATRTLARNHATARPAPPELSTATAQTVRRVNTKTPASVFLSGRKLIRKIIANTGNLPAVPVVMIKVQQMIGRPGTTPAQLSKLIETDPAMVVAILKVANSAYYGFRGKVTTIRHAAALFGTRRLAELITAMSAGGVLGKAMNGYGIKAGDMWRHAIAVAAASVEIAAEIGSDSLDEAYMAGLLHDVGKIILDPYLKKRQPLFEQFFAAHPQAAIQDAERAILGFDHAVIAAILCEKWNLPRSIAFSIRQHHQPSAAGDHQLSHIVHTADHLAIQVGLGDAGQAAAFQALDATSKESVAIDPDRLPAMLEKICRYVESLTGHISP